MVMLCWLNYLLRKIGIIPLVQETLPPGVLFLLGHLVALEAPVNVQYVTQTVKNRDHNLQFSIVDFFLTYKKSGFTRSWRTRGTLSALKSNVTLQNDKHTN